MTNKQVVKLKVTEARPKGLGLGTKLSLPSSHKSGNTLDNIAKIELS